MKKQIILLLLKYGIIKFNFKQPWTFKSGIKSPVYINLRECSAHPDLMSMILTLFKEQYPDFKTEVWMGVHSGAATYAERLSDQTQIPSAWVRPGAKAKDYGLQNLIEGATISGRLVRIIEDLVSTGGSILENAYIAQKYGAKAIKLSSVFSYGMKKASENFSKSGFDYEPLITMDDLLPELTSILTVKENVMLKEWVEDPIGWFNKYKTEFEFGFLTTLRQSAQFTGSIISMGLDPIIEALPDEFSKFGISGSIGFFKALISEMKSRAIMPSMWKPNEGFYTMNDRHNASNLFTGTQALNDLCLWLPSDMKYSGIPINIDAKSGDIGKSSANYAKQYLNSYQIGNFATTISPFMGNDSVSPFTDFCNYKPGSGGVYILNKTSNPGSNDFQMMRMQDGRFMYQHVSDKIVEWSKKKPGVGAVVGGTSLDELRTILKFYAGKDISVLVPGVGSQGGSAKDVANIAREVAFELELLRINSSSGLTHPWWKKLGDAIPTTNECIEICINHFIEMNNEIGAIAS